MSTPKVIISENKYFLGAICFECAAPAIVNTCKEAWSFAKHFQITCNNFSNLKKLNAQNGLLVLWHFFCFLNKARVMLCLQIMFRENITFVKNW